LSACSCLACKFTHGLPYSTLDSSRRCICERMGDRLRVVAVLIGGVTFAPAAFADQVDEAHRRLLEQKDLQFTFTTESERAVAQPNTGFLEFLRPLEPVFNVIFWGGLAVVILTILYFIGREVWQIRYGREQKPAKAAVQETVYRPEPERARALLLDADALAAEGRFEDAVRALLHRSIDDIEQRSPRSVRRAQTGREIAQLPLLSTAARDAFTPLVRAVERAWFGGARLDESDYNACRKAYADFALPEVWK
jgi:Domain of unknown function (DUF4129)